jgi:hypothetical protein
MRVRACEVPLVLRYDFKEGASKMKIGRTIRRYVRLMGKNMMAPGNRPFRRLPAGPVRTMPAAPADSGKAVR